MTPLAHYLAKMSMLPKAERITHGLLDNAGIVDQMPGVQCFEVSQIVPLWTTLTKKVFEAKDASHLFFLPAPLTWIELETSGHRHAFLLERTESGALCYSVTKVAEGTLSTFFGHFPLHSHTPMVAIAAEYDRQFSTKNAGEMAARVYGLLAAINSPKIMGRTTYLPHKGLERALIASGKWSRGFPLRAWTEIKLSVRRPDAPDYRRSETHLTGRTAYHFVRMFLRIRRGQLEYVRDHHRGNPNVGVKRSRYVVEHKSGDHAHIWGLGDVCEGVS
jgi:hypothetical protein